MENLIYERKWLFYTMVFVWLINLGMNIAYRQWMNVCSDIVILSLLSVIADLIKKVREMR